MNITLAKVAMVALFFSNTIKAHGEEEHENEHEHEEEISSSSDKFTIKESWLYGILSGVMLGILGLICSGLVVFMKKYTKISFNAILKVLIAFAAGALIGDAVVHLIPHAFAPHSHGEEASAEHDHGHEHEHEHGEEEEKVSEKLLSFFVCFGIATFALIERLFHIVGIGHSHGEKEGDDHHHHNDGDHHHHHETNENNKNQCSSAKGNQVDAQPQLKQGPSTVNMITSEMNYFEKKDSNINEEQLPMQKNQSTTEMVTKVAMNNSDEKLSAKIDLTKGWKHKKPEGYLNLIGDFLHNIMDGIALGVSFTSSTKSNAASTVVAIVAHEIPQEMGDVSILLNSNFSGLQAILCNGIVNFSGLVGIIVGITIASMNEKSERLMNCFIAGNFLYIGAVEMLPKISEEKSNKVAFLQIFSLCIGFGIMFLISLTEQEE